MTVQELIEQLQQFDPATEVHFQYNYGDHWRTQVAPGVKRLEEGYVKHSDYHSMDAVVDEDDEDYGEEEAGHKSVVLLS
jgi:hypothetical protein